MVEVFWRLWVQVISLFRLVLETVIYSPPQMLTMVFGLELEQLGFK